MFCTPLPGSNVLRTNTVWHPHIGQRHLLAGPESKSSKRHKIFSEHSVRLLITCSHILPLSWKISTTCRKICRKICRSLIKGKTSHEAGDWPALGAQRHTVERRRAVKGNRATCVLNNMRTVFRVNNVLCVMVLMASRDIDKQQDYNNNMTATKPWQPRRCRYLWIADILDTQRFNSSPRS